MEEDWKKYAEMLEDIISHIDLKDSTRALVNYLCNDAMTKCGIKERSER